MEMAPTINYGGPSPGWKRNLAQMLTNLPIPYDLYIGVQILRLLIVG